MYAENLCPGCGGVLGQDGFCYYEECTGSPSTPVAEAAAEQTDEKKKPFPWVVSVVVVALIVMIVFYLL